MGSLLSPPRRAPRSSVHLDVPVVERALGRRPSLGVQAEADLVAVSGAAVCDQLAAAGHLAGGGLSHAYPVLAGVRDGASIVVVARVVVVCVDAAAGGVAAVVRADV